MLTGASSLLDTIVGALARRYEHGLAYDLMQGLLLLTHEGDSSKVRLHWQRRLQSPC